MDKFAFMNDLCNVPTVGVKSEEDKAPYMVNFDEAVKSFQNEIDVFYDVVQGITNELGEGHVKVDPIDFTTSGHPPKFIFELDQKSSWVGNDTQLVSPSGWPYTVTKEKKNKFALVPFTY